MSEYLQKYKVAFKGTHRVGTMINNDKKVWPAKSGGPSVDVTIPFYVENNTNEQKHIFVSSTRFPYISKSYDNENYIVVNGDLEEVIQQGTKVYLKCLPFDGSGGYYSNTPLIIAPKVGGNIASLYYGNNFNGQTKIDSSVYSPFCYLFPNCDILTDASELYLLEELPAAAYDSMFKNCTSLTKAPALPATVLTTNCYSSMFWGCTSLTKAPDLPATTLTDSCYRNMFYDCTSLTKAPELPATNFNGNSSPYYGMFQGCTSLVEGPNILPIMNIPDSQSYNAFYGYMFGGCTSLTKAPELPATTLGSYCYYYMFQNCKSLTKAPALPATTLGSYCYHNMFFSCTLLTQVPELPATILADHCYSYMFSGCTSLTKAPELPATTLADNCYSGMFSACTSLTEVPNTLRAATLTSYCYANMFSGCTSLTKAPELPATTLANRCYSDIFYNCTSLTSVYMMARNNITMDNLGYYLPWPTNTYKEGTLTLYNQSVYNTIYNIYKDDYNFVGVVPKYWTINYIN